MLLSINHVRPAIFPARNWPELDLIGAKMGENRPKWAGNGPKTGRDGHVSLQTGGKHERACIRGLNLQYILTDLTY